MGDLDPDAFNELLRGLTWLTVGLVGRAVLSPFMTGR